jgi:hypothetical protein
MVDTPAGAEQPAAATAPRGPSGEVELEVAVASFLPDGVQVAATERDGFEAEPAEHDPLEALEQELDAVDAAIERLDAGTYGLDQVTGLPIDDALLAADPTRLTGEDAAG